MKVRKTKRKTIIGRTFLKMFLGFILGFTVCTLMNFNTYIMDVDMYMDTANDTTDIGFAITANNTDSDSDKDLGITVQVDDVHNRGSTSIIEENDNYSNYNNFCSLLVEKSQGSQQQQGPHIHTPSTISLWTEHILHPISQSLGNLYGHEYHDFVSKLLNIMTPQRLQYTVKNIPRKDEQWKRIGHILNLGFERYKYIKEKQNHRNRLKHSTSSVPRKVNILVMGGSVTAGVDCWKINPVKKRKGNRKNCAWPARLNVLLNALLINDGRKRIKEEDEIIHIDSIAMGGTNTEIASHIWDYSLLPKDIPYPDIIIHAFSTNDMHIVSMKDARSGNMTLEDHIRKINQNFIGKVLQPKLSTSKHVKNENTNNNSSKCKFSQPLLIYYDDYIGNEQKLILETLSYYKAIQILSSYYGLSFVSYADAVKDLVYANTNEEWLSPNNWPNRQIHPGMGMHIVSTWVHAFNFVHLASTFCSINGTATETGTATGFLSQNQTHDGSSKVKDYIPINGLPKLKDPDTVLAGEPNQTPNIHPPELNDSLSLDNISDLWNKKAREYYHDYEPIQECNNDYESSSQYNYNMPQSCLFTWGSVLGFETPKELEEKLNKVTISNDGWDFVNDYGKPGYSPIKNIGSSFEIEFNSTYFNENNSMDVVKTLNFLVMRSYGERWEGSEIKVRVRVQLPPSEEGGERVITESMNIIGFHHKNTSEAYAVQLNLKEPKENKDGAIQIQNLKVHIELVGGKTFKIHTMAFCDH